MTQQGKLKGIFTPNIVPLTGSGEINEPELRRYTDWLIDHGVHGLYPNGSTGEFVCFTPEEPIGGCPAGRAEVDPEQVAKVVRDVLDELRHRGAV